MTPRALARPEPQQLRQTRQTAPAPQELVLQQLGRARPALDIHTQTDAQKRLELLAQLLRLLEPRRSVRRNQPQRLERLFVQIRRLGFDHLNGHDAEGPDVDLGAVFLLLDDLGRHPVGGADHCGAFGLLLGELCAEAKVCDFDGAERGEENVVGFDVAVDNVLEVQVFKAFARLCGDIHNSALEQWTGK